MARGDEAMNPLDAACEEHDIECSKNPEDITGINVAENILAGKAWKRVMTKAASFGEQLHSL